MRSRFAGWRSSRLCPHPRDEPEKQGLLPHVRRSGDVRRDRRRRPHPIRPRAAADRPVPCRITARRASVDFARTQHGTACMVPRGGAPNVIRRRGLLLSARNAPEGVRAERPNDAASPVTAIRKDPVTMISPEPPTATAQATCTTSPEGRCAPIDVADADRCARRAPRPRGRATRRFTCTATRPTEQRASPSPVFFTTVPPERPTAAHDGIVTIEHRFPAGVAERRGLRGRRHEIGEHQAARSRWGGGRVPPCGRSRSLPRRRRRRPNGKWSAPGSLTTGPRVARARARPLRGEYQCCRAGATRALTDLVEQLVAGRVSNTDSQIRDAVAGLVPARPAAVPPAERRVRGADGAIFRAIVVSALEVVATRGAAHHPVPCVVGNAQRLVQHERTAVGAPPRTATRCRQPSHEHHGRAPRRVDNGGEVVGPLVEDGLSQSTIGSDNPVLRSNTTTLPSAQSFEQPNESGSSSNNDGTRPPDTITMSSPDRAACPRRAPERRRAPSPARAALDLATTCSFAAVRS